MDARTLEALKASIAKWERNAAAEHPDDILTGTDDCPLCQLFFRDSCNGCPVRERTGDFDCQGSPYERAYDAKFYWQIGTGSKKGAQAAARKEVAFLKSLLPEESSQ